MASAHIFSPIYDYPFASKSVILKVMKGNNFPARLCQFFCQEVSYDQ